MSPGLILFGKARRAILALLYGWPDREFHMREIVRSAKVGPGATQRELQKLVAASLLTRRDQGNLSLYRANRNSGVYPELHALVLKTAGLVEVLRRALEPLRQRLEVAFVYGSVAAGRETPASDVDLMLIGDVTLDEVVRALLDSQEHVGREINPNILTVRNFTEGLRNENRFLLAVLRAPRLYVIGGDDELSGLVGQRLVGTARDVGGGDR